MQLQRVLNMLIVKRKLEFHAVNEEEIGKIVNVLPTPPKSQVQRCIKHKTILSHSTTTHQNKLHYHHLFDGVISAFSAKGTANGSSGNVQSVGQWQSIPNCLKCKDHNSFSHLWSFDIQGKTAQLYESEKLYIYEENNNNLLKHLEKCRHLIIKFDAKFHVAHFSRSERSNSRDDKL